MKPKEYLKALPACCKVCSSCGPNSRGCAGQQGCSAGPGWRRGCCQLGTAGTAMPSFPVGPRGRAESVSITGNIAGSIAAATPRARVRSARHPRRTGWECLSSVCIKSSFLDAVTAVLGAFRGLVSGIAPCAVRERSAGQGARGLQRRRGPRSRPGPSRPRVGRCEQGNSHIPYSGGDPPPTPAPRGARVGRRARPPPPRRRQVAPTPAGAARHFLANFSPSCSLG